MFFQEFRDFRLLDLSFFQSASFIKVVSYFLLILALIFFSFSSRSTSNTGERVRDLPSVEIEIGVSASMLSNSRTGLSNINARLLPCFVKVFITSITPFLQSKHNVSQNFKKARKNKAALSDAKIA